jgi:hypothetical protein
VVMSMPASDHFADGAVWGMVGGGVDRRRAMEGGPPQPYPTRRSGWLSPEDYGDRRNTTRKLIAGSLN